MNSIHSALVEVNNTLDVIEHTQYKQHTTTTKTEEKIRFMTNICKKMIIKCLARM